MCLIYRGAYLLFGLFLSCPTAYFQALTGSQYLTRPDLFLEYPTRPVPKIENDWVPGTCYFILTEIKHGM